MRNYSHSFVKGDKFRKSNLSNNVFEKESKKHISFTFAVRSLMYAQVFNIFDNAYSKLTREISVQSRVE